MAPPRERTRGAAIWLAVALSGTAALGDQIAWIRRSTLVFGVSSAALATVVAVFFGGLALGSELFGRRSSSVARPLRTAGRLEIGIGVLALLSPLTFDLAETVYGALYPLASGSPGLLTAARVALVAVVVLPPTVLMGGTLPLLCRGLVVAEGAVGRGVARVYAVNTLGAAAGAGLAGLLTVPALGLRVTLALAGATSLVAGVVLLRAGPRPTASSAATPAAAGRASRRNRSHGRDHRAPPEGTRTGPAAFAPAGRAGPAAALLVVVALTGFAALGEEVVWARFLALLVRQTMHVQTLTLVTVLAGIVVGSALAAGLVDRVADRVALFTGLQIAHGLLVLGLLLLPPAFWGEVGGGATTTGRLALLGAVLLVPAALMGASFPLAVRLAVADPSRAGFGAGRVAAANTAGGIVGSLVVAFAVLPWWGQQAALLTVTGASLVAAGVAGLALGERRPGALRLATLAGAAGLWLLLPWWTGTRLPHDHLAPPDRLVDVAEGHGPPLSVVRRGEHLALEIDRLWQGESRKTHQIVAAHVPMIVHGDARRVVVVGAGTGQTASRFLMHDPERLTVVDLEPRLFDLVREHFDGGWLDDPRVEVVVEDGRSLLAFADRTWDVVSIEVGQTFRPGVVSLYTESFYRRAVGRLAPGGLLCQFVPVGILRADELASVIGTFVSVLPEAMLWYNTSELLLIGRADGPLEIARDDLALIGQPGPVRDDLAYAYWGGHAYHLNRLAPFLGGFLCGPEALARLAQGARPVTDDLPWLEAAVAARARGLDQDAEREVVALLSRHLSPVSDVLDRPLEVSTAAEVTAIQAANVADLPSRSLCRRAYDLQLAGRWEESLLLLDEARRLNPGSVLAQRLTAVAHARRGRDDHAAEAWERAVALDPEDPDLRVNLATARMRLGAWERAIEHLEAALALGERSLEVRVNLGYALMESGRPEQAVVHFEGAVADDPDHLDAAMNLAIARSTAGDLEGAAKAYREVVARHPGEPRAHYNLGTVLNRLGDREAAVEAFRRAIDLDPDLAQAHVNLGNALSSLGRPTEALESFRRAAALEPDRLEARFNQGVLLARMGHVAEAEEELRAAAEIAPDAPVVPLELGRLLYEDGRQDEAVGLFRRAALMGGGDRARAHLLAAERGAPLPD